MKKIAYILLPLFLFIFLACTGNDVEEQTGNINNETNKVQEDDGYKVHVPETEFEIGLRNIIDETFQEYIGYSEVITESGRTDSWGYRLHSPMTQEDWIALDSALAHPSISYAIEGNDDSITFEMHLIEYSGSVEKLDGFMGTIDIGDTTYYWIGEEREQIFWIGILW